jgi:histidine triad (HIT) family protein
VSDCLFCKIVAGKIPAKVVYEDEDILAFNDINPLRPVHVLVIPKKHITSLATASAEDTAGAWQDSRQGQRNCG